MNGDPITDQLLFEKAEALRLPFEAADLSPNWKEWYHYLFFDLKSGTRLLFNCCLTGRPEAGMIQITALLTAPQDQPEKSEKFCTYGNAWWIPWEKNMLQRDPIAIEAQGLNLRITLEKTSIFVEDLSSNLSFRLEGSGICPPLVVTESSPFGSGFIGWALVPQFRFKGQIQLCEQIISVDDTWTAYHDHNFGRFHWGEDIGWEWLVAFFKTSRKQNLQLIFDQRTDQAHSGKGLPYIFLYVNDQLRKIFIGATLSIQWERETHPLKPIRLPGVMASLLNYQTTLAPKSITVWAKDDQDSLTAEFEVEKFMELIVPDNQHSRYSVMEEITGKAILKTTLAGQKSKAAGLFYAEYVR